MLYDIFVFCYKLYECSMFLEFIQCVYGCVDMFKFVYKLYKKEDVGNYKQFNLVNILLGKFYVVYNFLEDVKILYEFFIKKLICYFEDFFFFYIYIFQKFFKIMVEKKVMLVVIFRKIVGFGLGFWYIMFVYKCDEFSGVKIFLGEYGMKGKVVFKMIEYLKVYEE